MSSATESLPPMVAEIAAPAATVYALLSLELPNSLVQPLPDESPEGRTVRIDAESAGRWRSVEVVIPQPPDNVTYRLLEGPCAGLERQFHVRERHGQCRVLVESTWTPGGIFNRMSRQRQIAQATRCLLSAVQQQAERLARLRLVQPQTGAIRPLSQISEDPDNLKHRLLIAVEEQERAEWETPGHGHITGRYSAALGASVGLPPDVCRMLELAGCLHDVGKTRVESYLFNRSSTLSAAGQRRIEQHPQFGAAQVLHLPGSDLLVPAVRHHHERWDGAGYPDGLEGARIPLPARIVGVAESADAMARSLPDRRARTPQEIALILERHAGRQWDPDLAHRLAALLRQTAAPEAATAG